MDEVHLKKERHSLKKWICLLLYFVFLNGSGLYLFTSGFFLTRYEVKNESPCYSQELLKAKHGGEKQNLRTMSKEDTNKTGGCWLPKKFDRLVFVIIDALRYDFASHVDLNSLSPTEMKEFESMNKKFFINHLPILHETLKENPSNSALYKFYADPPTMTMQRLKGLTTGSLPTFLDIKDNMHSTEIVEDNIIQQMWNLNRRIVFMGDNTWDMLYSKFFYRNYSYDSFNVKDLHTVDNGVIKNIFPELRRNDWDMIIAHFLGVDHVGHTYGPSTAHMQSKLEQMNDVIKQIFNSIDNNTLVVLMGDHGMSADGNHGGATDDETGAALYLYSKKKLFESLDSSHISYENWNSGIFKATKGIGHTTVPQVSLAPTISLLMGLPIPFGNLGTIIPELFFTSKLISMDADAHNHNDNILRRFENLIISLELNARQVRNYLKVYSNVARMSFPKQNELEILFNKALLLKAKVETSQISIDEKIKICGEVSSIFKLYLEKALHLGREMWTQFDFCLMSWGVVILFLSLVLVISVTYCSINASIVQVLAYSFLLSSLCSLPSFSFDTIPSNKLHQILVFNSVGSSLSLLYSIFKNQLKQQFYSPLSLNLNAINCGAVLVILLHVLCLLSNSYIVAEHHIFIFLSCTVGVILFVEKVFCASKFKLQKVPSKYFLFQLAIVLMTGRIASLVPPCNIIHTLVSWERTIIPMVLFAFFVIKYHVKVNRSTTTYVSLWLNLLNLFVCTIYWLTLSLKNERLLVLLPRSVFFTSICGLLLIVCKNKSVKDLSKIGELKKDIIMMIFYLISPYLLVLGPTSPLTVLLICLQSTSFFSASWNIQFGGNNICAKRENRFCLSMSFIALWCILCNHYYYVTGHHNDFSSLQNASGFVGFNEFNFYYAGILLGYNTFGSIALSVLSIPLFWVWPYDGKLSNPPVITICRMSFVVSGYYLLNALTSTIFVAFQRRHLMVWAIFAPKFIFDGLSLIVVNCCMLLMAILVHKIY